MSKGGRRVLLVEDDQFLRRACEKSLARDGLTVLTAADGEEALRAVQAQAPDLILLDVLMPRLTGIEVLRILRSDERTRAIPVIVLTNSSKDTDVREVESLGAAGYLVKANLSLKELGHKVKEVLEAQSETGTTGLAR
jgi:CheY-like chemotaxis protein